MKGGNIQQIGTPQDIYNEPNNAFVADFIGESNIIDGVMLRDFRVEFAGQEFTCVDKGFAPKEFVQVVDVYKRQGQHLVAKLDEFFRHVAPKAPKANQQDGFHKKTFSFSVQTLFHTGLPSGSVHTGKSRAAAKRAACTGFSALSPRLFFPPAACRAARDGRPPRHTAW